MTAESGAAITVYVTRAPDSAVTILNFARALSDSGAAVLESRVAAPDLRLQEVGFNHASPKPGVVSFKANDATP